MRGIFGICNLNGEPVNEDYLRKMRDKVSQDRRDIQTLSIDRNVGFGGYINKYGMDRPGEIPICSDEQRDLMLIGDALIYNRAELIEKCDLSHDRDISTQMLLLEIYRKWGEDCPKYLNGDFAFVIWEKQKKRLFVARDHLGVRPFYYFYNHFVFVFATDYRALLVLPFVERRLNDIKLYAIFSNMYHIDPEATCFAQIKKLPQAHVLRIDEQGLSKSKYWVPGAGGKIIYPTEEEYAQALFEIVNDAIKIRVNSVTGKIGVELSGGLDSSVITVLANRELRNATKQLGKVYSWSPPLELLEKQPGDERELIKAVCLQEGLDCVYHDPRRNVDDGDAMIGLPPEAPGGGDALDPELEFMFSHDVRYILSGWGGDDGISHRGGLYELLLEGYFGYFLTQALWLAKGSALRFVKIIMANTVMQWFRPFSYFGRSDKGIPEIINDEFKKKMKRHCKKDILYFGVNAVKNLESGVIQTRTELSAWLGARYGVQHLYPFLDYRVVDFAVSIPRYLYYKHGINRYLYRKAFSGILPPQFKHYFTKDDPAKSIFLWKRAAAEYENIKEAAGKIDRSLFHQYIDWDKLQNVLNSFVSEDDFRKRHFFMLKKKIQVCTGIQQILREVDVDGLQTEDE